MIKSQLPEHDSEQKSAVRAILFLLDTHNINVLGVSWATLRTVAILACVKFIETAERIRLAT